MRKIVIIAHQNKMGMFDVNLSLPERVSRLLESKECSDCSFVLSGKVVKAHRLILGISSPVFKAMLYGPMASNEDINISDIEPGVFQLLLDFIYTDKITINNLDDCCNILYAAKKYMMEVLVKKCLDFIENEISIDEVACIFNFADFIQEKRLWSICLTLICEHADVVLRRDVHLLNVSCLKAILSQDKLNAKENILVEAVMIWTEQYCIEHSLQLTDMQMREFLAKEGIFQLLRLPSAGSSILNTRFKNLLTGHEIDALESQWAVNTLVDKDPQAREQCKLKQNIVRRDLLRTLGPVLVDSTVDTITTIMKSSKTVFVNGFHIPTRMSSSIVLSGHPKSYKEHIVITIKPLQSQQNSLMLTHTFDETVDYDSSVLLKFLEPLIFEKNVFYIVKLHWPKVKSEEYLVSFRKDQCIHKSVFTFIDTVKNLNFCSFIEGLSFCI